MQLLDGGLTIGHLRIVGPGINGEEDLALGDDPADFELSVDHRFGDLPTSAGGLRRRSELATQRGHDLLFHRLCLAAGTELDGCGSAHRSAIGDDD